MTLGILAIVVFIGVVVLVGLLADPMEIGRTMNRSFTQGMDSLFGCKRGGHT